MRQAITFFGFAVLLAEMEWNMSSVWETFTFCVCTFLSQPPTCSTQDAPLSRATSGASTTPVAASVPRFQGEWGISPAPVPVPVQTPCWVQLISPVCSFQGAQQNPGSKFLPDGSRRPPASLGGWLLLSLQYDQLLQQPEQDCQITQRSLRPRNLPPQLTVSVQIWSYLSHHSCINNVFKSNPVCVDFNCQLLSNLTVTFKERVLSIHFYLLFPFRTGFYSS